MDRLQGGPHVFCSVSFFPLLCRWDLWLVPNMAQNMGYHSCDLVLCYITWDFHLSRLEGGKSGWLDDACGQVRNTHVMRNCGLPLGPEDSLWPTRSTNLGPSVTQLQAKTSANNLNQSAGRFFLNQASRWEYNPADSLTVQRMQLSHTCTPDLQKLWNDWHLCFKPLSCGTFLWTTENKYTV